MSSAPASASWDLPTRGWRKPDCATRRRRPPERPLSLGYGSTDFAGSHVASSRWARLAGSHWARRAPTPVHLSVVRERRRCRAGETLLLVQRCGRALVSVERRCRAGKALLLVQRCGWALAPAHAPYPPERPVDGVRRPTSAARKDARTAAAQRVAPAAHAAS